MLLDRRSAHGLQQSILHQGGATAAQPDCGVVLLPGSAAQAGMRARAAGEIETEEGGVMGNGSRLEVQSSQFTGGSGLTKCKTPGCRSGAVPRWTAEEDFGGYCMDCYEQALELEESTESACLREMREAAELAALLRSQELRERFRGAGRWVRKWLWLPNLIFVAGMLFYVAVVFSAAVVQWVGW